MVRQYQIPVLPHRVDLSFDHKLVIEIDKHGHRNY